MLRRKYHSMKLGIEALEDRLAPAIDTATLFDGLASYVQSAEAPFVSIVSSAKTTLPVIGEGINVYAKQVQTAIDSLDKQIQSLGQIADINQAIAKLNQLSPNVQVQLKSEDSNSGSIELVLNITEPVITKAFSFNAGLKGLPFTITTAGGGTLKLSVNLDNLDFGLNNNSFTLSNNGANPAHIQLVVDGELKVGSTLQGNFGLFKITATAGAFSADPNNPGGVGLVGSLATDITGNGSVSAPYFQGLQAIAYLHLTGSLGVDAGNQNAGSYQVSADQANLTLPNIKADLHFVWNLTGSNTSNGILTSQPSVSLDNVEVGLGSYIDSAMAPVVNFIQETTAPINPLLQFLDAPIPGFSDIGAGKISILTLANLVNDQGVLPPGIQQIVSLVIDLSQLLAAIDQLKIDPNNGVYLNIGSFSLSDNSNAGSWDAQSLGALAGSFGQMVNSQLNDNDPVQHAIKAKLQGVISQLAAMDTGFHLSFPFVEDPLNSAIQLLLGNDADIVTFSANLDTPGGERTLADIPIWGPVSLQITTDVQIHLHFQIGYDTFGIREFFNNQQPKDLLDGLYIDSSQPLVDITGGLHAKVGIPPTAPVGITGVADGGLDGYFRLGLSNDGTGKLRPFDYSGGQLFNVEGELSAHLSIEVDGYVGPFQATLFSLPIASGTIFSSSQINSANPVNPPTLPNTFPSFGTAAQPVVVDLSPYSNASGVPDDVQVYLEHDAKGPHIMVEVNGYTLPAIDVVTTASLTLQGTNNDTQFVINTPGVDVNVKGGTGQNSLIVDDRGYHSAGLVTGIEYQVTDHSVGYALFESMPVNITNVNYSGINNLQLIVGSDKNTIEVDSLPAFPVEIDTTKQLQPISSRLLRGGNLFQAVGNGYVDFSPITPLNNIVLRADAISNGQYLTVVGNSGNDSLTVNDDSTSAVSLGGLFNEPKYVIDPTQLTLAHYVHVSGVNLNQLMTGTIDFTGLKSVTIDGQNNPSGQPVNRAYQIDAWNAGTTLTLQGGAGNDIFTIGNGDLDSVSGPYGDNPKIGIDGGGGSDTVVFDDSQNANTPYTDANGQTIPVHGSQPVGPFTGSSNTVN